MLLKLNLQKFAVPIGVQLNITLDSGIESIHMTTPDEDVNTTITSNGGYGSINNTITTFVVTLKSGYTMDKVLVGTSEVTATSENTYQYTFNTDEIAVSFTSKKSTSKLITIKFKDELNYTSPIPSGDDDVTFNVTFICDNVTYSRIYINKDTISMSYDSSQIWDSRGWSNTNYQYITLDTNQTNFDAFITAMKDNIEGVLLESGTYKWVDELDVTVPNVFYLDYSSNNVSYTRIIVDRNTGVEYSNDDTINNYVYLKSSGWEDNIYKTITTTEDQYIDYDFYNYAILDNQLVKQGDTPTTSYSITYNLTNCTSDSSNPTTISDTASVIVTANRGYKLPSTITVTNATYTYEQSTGMIDLSDPTGDVTITVVATQDDIIVYENQLTSIANAIRQVNSSSAKIKLDDMPDLINSFSKPTGTKTITDTNLTDVKNYANAQVSDAKLASANIVTGITILGISGSFSSDGTLDASKMLKGVIGYSKGVKYTGTIETYSGSSTITSNGTVNTAGKYLPSNLTINVVTPTQEKSVTITENGETSVTPDANYHLSKVTITTNVARPTLSGDATEDDVLQGKTFYSNDYNLKTGTFVPLTYEELLAATYPPIIQDGDMLIIYNADATQEGDEVTIL